MLPANPADAAGADDVRIGPELYCDEFLDYEEGEIAELHRPELLRRGAAIELLPLDLLKRLDPPTLCFMTRHFPARLPDLTAALQSMKSDPAACLTLWEGLCKTDRPTIVANAVRRLNQGFPAKPTCGRLRDFFNIEARTWGIQNVTLPLPCTGPAYNLAMALYNLRRLTYADHATDPSLQSVRGRVATLYDEITARGLKIRVAGGPEAAPADPDAPPESECRTIQLTERDLGPAGIHLPEALAGIDPSLLVSDWIGERLVHEARRTYHPDYPPTCGAQAEFLSGRARTLDPGPVDCERGQAACDLTLGSWWGGAFSWSVLWWNIVETFPGKLDSTAEIDEARRLHARYRKYHCIQNCFQQVPSIEEIGRVLNREPPKAPAVGAYVRIGPAASETRAFDAPAGTWVWTLHPGFWSSITEVRGEWVETIVREPESNRVSRVWVRGADVELLP